MSAPSTYKLAEADAQRRLAEMPAGPVGDDDVRLCRMLLEKASDDGQLSLAAKLFSELSRVATAADNAAEKRGRLIPKDQMLEWASAFTTIVIDIFHDGSPESDDRVDELVTRIQSLFEDQE